MKDLTAMQPTKARADLWMDLALMAFLIGLDVAARLLPHAPGFMPVAASALFAGRVLRIPALAVIVPLAAMGLSGLALAPESWRVEAVVYAAISVPAIVGMLSRRYSGLGATAAIILSCSLFFFATSNFAVWFFGSMYSHDFAGLTQCYVLALPFLQNSVAGDLFWSAVLFGGAWAIQNGAMLAGRAR
jgi:hypothetical protein